MECVRRLAETIPEAVALTDGRGNVLYANPVFQSLCANLGMETTPAFLKEPLRLWSELGFHRQAIEIEASPASRRTLDLTVSTLWAQGVPEGLPVVILRDLPPRLDLERHKVLAQRLASLGTVAGSLSETLSQELHQLLAVAEALKPMLQGAQPLYQAFGNLFQAAMSAANLSRQLKGLAPDKGDALLPLDLSKLLRETAALISARAPKGVEVQTQSSSAVWVAGSVSRLQQALLNLALNAFDAMGDGGTLALSLEEVALASDSAAELGLAPGRHARLVVSDTGCGMGPDVLQHAFDPFFTTKPPELGVGLGLSQVVGVLTQHRGSLEVDSAPRVGTRITLHFPCTVPPAPTVGPHPSRALLGAERLLLVDPDTLSADVLRHGLKALGYQVDHAVDPHAAIDLVKEHPAFYDLVLVELVMPRMGGLDVAHRLRHLRRDLPIVLLTSLPSSTNGLLESHTQLTDVLSKPMTPADAAACIRKHVKAAQAQPAPPATQAGTVLLAEDSGVTRAMVKTWLSQAGFNVLEAADGQTAWELLQAQGTTVDLLLSDVVMPRMDGLELARRARDIDASLPIAIMTTVEDRDTVKSALHLGVNDFLNKPFQRDVLLECVHRLLEAQEKRHVARRSLETAQAVRLAQSALLAVAEHDLPLFTLYEPLSDAGGDIFRAQRRPDGSVFFILGDVAGHSVISSYAVAAFLGMLGSFAGTAETLHDLAMKLNQGIQEGPFSEVPVCTLLGHWQPDVGRLSLLNAGIPHGVIYRKSLDLAEPIPLNGNPLGILPQPILGETVVHLFEGDRLLFGTDGFFEVLSAEHRPFEESVPTQWRLLRESPVQWALSLICEAARAHGEGVLSDDLLVVAFEQGPLAPTRQEWMWDIASDAAEIDKAIHIFKSFIEASEAKDIFPESRLFDISLVLREALTNAVFHGNRGQSHARVKLHAQYDPEHGVLEVGVGDQGLGFLPPEHAPTRDICSDRGRGIPLMRHFAQAVHFLGGEVRLIFSREGPPHDLADHP